MRWTLALSLLVIACGTGDESTGNAAAADAEATSLVQSIVPILEEQSCPVPSPSPSDQPQAVLAVRATPAGGLLAEAAQICRDECQAGAKSIRGLLYGRWAWLGFISCPVTTVTKTACLQICAEAEQKFEMFAQNIQLALFEDELKLLADAVWQEAMEITGLSEQVHLELKVVAGSVRAIMNSARRKIRQLAFQQR